MNAPLPKALSRKGTAPAPKLKKWAPQEVALVERLRNQGLTFSQIACSIGVSKSAIISLYRNRIDPVADAGGPVGMRWRVRQLLTAGYGPRAISDWIGVPMALALDEFSKWEAGE